MKFNRLKLSQLAKYTIRKKYRACYCFSVVTNQNVLVRGLSLDLIERKSINNQVDVVDSRTKTGADPT